MIQSNWSAVRMYLLVAMAVVLSACQDEDLDTALSVYTEEIVFSSGEQAVMTGRILASGRVSVEDHGFQIDTSDSFSNPLVLSLGEKELPGRFVGQTGQLDIRTTYYCRAFLVSDGSLTTGNTLTFSTLSPRVTGLDPLEGNPGTRLIAEGQNLTGDTRILWNNQVIDPEEIIAETFVHFRVPPFDNEPVIDLRLISREDTLPFPQPFEYIIGTWTNEGAFGDPDKNTKHIYFEAGNDFVYGLGLSRGDMTAVVQVMDQNTLEREVLIFPGTPVEGAFFDATYFGGGSTEKVFSPNVSIPLSKQFWKYEDHGFVQLADVPVALYKAVALVTGDKLYLYGGENENRLRNTRIYSYDIGTDQWSILSHAPLSPLNAYPAFHLGDYNYFVTENGETYRHQYASDNWETVAPHPVAPDEYGVSLTLDGKAYAGMHGTGRTMYVYRPGNDSWRTLKSLQDFTSYVTSGGWTNDDRLYIIRTETADFTNRLIWSLDPDGY